MSLTWELDAACRGMDPDLFFPERGSDGTDSAAAKACCAQCPVRSECLEAHLHERLGIWGGMTSMDRRAERRRRRLNQLVAS